MERQNFVHDFQQKVLEMLRASPAADLERNLKALMGQTFNKLELVTRSEFEIQVELLRVLRERVEALEKRLAEAPGSAASAYTGHTAGQSAGQSAAHSAGYPGTAGTADLLRDPARPADPYTNPSES